MKERISATIDKKTVKIINGILKKGGHRNRSHIIEEAIKLYSRKSRKND